MTRKRNFASYSALYLKRKVLITLGVLFSLAASAGVTPLSKTCDTLMLETAPAIPSPVLSNEEIQDIESLLKNGYRGAEPNSEVLWSDNVFKEKNGREVADYLDLEVLGFSNGDFVSKQRIVDAATHPLLNADEIRQRQQAVSEIQRPLYSQLSKIFEGAYSRRWRGFFFSSFQTIGQKRPTFPEPIWGYDIRDPKTVSDPSLRKIERAKIAHRADMFEEMKQLSEILGQASSPRLQQLRWLLSAASDPAHPYKMYSWVEKFKEANTLQRQTRLRMDLWDETLWGEDLHSKLELVQKAYGELALYYDIAKNALEKNYGTLPKVLDPNEAEGPVLEISKGVAPRLLLESKNPVPNSISANKTKARNLIVTGPNREGKSTFIRMVAQLLVLAQMGSPVPAETMSLTPLSLVVYVHPSDNPQDQESLFMAETRVLWTDVMLRSKRSKFSLTLLDEMRPGTIEEIRNAIETEFLTELGALGGISITSTHNWTTVGLPEINPQLFRNLHVSKYHVLPGKLRTRSPMDTGALDILKKNGWSPQILRAIRSRLSRAEE